jgi:hypothetical protein
MKEKMRTTSSAGRSSCRLGLLSLSLSSASTSTSVLSRFLLVAPALVPLEPEAGHTRLDSTTGLGTRAGAEANTQGCKASPSPAAFCLLRRGLWSPPARSPEVHEALLFLPVGPVVNHFPRGGYVVSHHLRWTQQNARLYRGSNPVSAHFFAYLQTKQYCPAFQEEDCPAIGALKSILSWGKTCSACF